MSTANSNTHAPAGTVMWWDGGERAITAREKCRIEEHSPSCFTIPLAPPVNVDNLLADCVPGGNITDPQAVADNIRAWFAKPGNLAEQRGVELPPLPSVPTEWGTKGDLSTGYSAEQMQDYARAALAANGKQQVGVVPESVSKKAVRQFIADRAPNDEHREDILSGDYDHTLWFDHIRELMEALDPRQPGTQTPALTFSAFRNANVSRCEKWHPEGIGSWSPSDWLTAAMGELGELASEVKMHNRVRDGLAGNKEQITTEERTCRMANEAADVVTYLDLFCAERGIDLGAALVRKFNQVSERVGFPDRLDPASAQGIDLEKARDEGHDGAIRYVLGYLNGVGDWGSTQYVEILNACGRERIIQSAVQDGELEFTGLGRWVAERGTDKDRALIDQRDAAPGVTP